MLTNVWGLYVHRDIIIIIHLNLHKRSLLHKINIHIEIFYIAKLMNYYICGGHVGFT